MGERTGATQETYHLEAYDCSKPEDAIIYSIPQSCPTKEERKSTPELSRTTRQNYTILQEVATFDYPATLCIVHRSQGYYDCVWKSNVRIAAPATIYQQNNVLVSECALMKLTRTVRDPLIRLRH